MAFPQSFLDELAARNDILDVVGSYVSLQPKGGSYWGCCPFHNEKTPSFHVLQDKQYYHCFGCKKGGGVINFIMDIENLSYPDAVRFLAKRVNMPVPEDRESDGADRLRRRLLDLNRDAARYYYEVLQSPDGAAVQAYLNRRQIRRGIAVRFGMGAARDGWDHLLRAMTEKGYTKQELLKAGLIVQNKSGGFYDKFRNRLILPVVDVRGDVVGFGSRVIDKSEPKYMNTSETPVYSKRRVLYGLNLAKKTKRPNIILCEGNLDVVTLHQAGFDNAVASMGTALTVEQTRLLSRYTKELILCYDNDNAGQLATQRALDILKNSEFTVRAAEVAGLTPEAMRNEVSRTYSKQKRKEQWAETRREMNPVATLQPQARAFRYANLRSAMAEEGVIRLMMRDDDLYDKLCVLRPEEFSSPLLGKIYSLLCADREAGRPHSMAALGGILSPEEMSHFTAILQKPESVSGAEQALSDYIRIIREEADRQIGGDELDPLLAAQEKYKFKKGYGGKNL